MGRRLVGALTSAQHPNDGSVSESRGVPAAAVRSFKRGVQHASNRISAIKWVIWYLKGPFLSLFSSFFFSLRTTKNIRKTF